MEPRNADKPLVHGQERPYAKMVLVCTKGPECPLDGPAAELRLRMKNRVKQMGLTDEVRVTNSGCLGQCGHGPVIATYPDGTWYSHVDEAGADAIIESVIEGSGPVDDYRFRLGPGGQKALRSDGGKTSCDGQACRT